MDLRKEAQDWKITCSTVNGGTDLCLSIEAKVYSQESLGVLISILTILSPELPRKNVPLPLAACAYCLHR